MRKALNENPLVQMGVLAVLALGVAVLLITRMGGSSAAPATTTGTPAPVAGTTAAIPAPSTSADAGTPTTPSPAAPTTAAPGTPTAAAPVTAAPSSAAAGSPPAAGVTVGEFTAGPGLPQPVVSAYDANKAVVLLIVRKRGIDDKPVKRSVEQLRSRGDTAVFVTGAGEISRYSRIASGVDVNQVPALVVITPKDLSKGGEPTASVSYGFRGAPSIVQAVDDALYSGKQIPYYPR